MKVFRLTMLFAMALLIGWMSSCHTWPWQSVRRLLVGRWKETPIDKTKKGRIWQFDGSTVTILEETAPGSGVYTAVYQTQYSVRWNGQAHVIVAPLPHEQGPMKWHIVKINRQVLYIANIAEPSRNLYNGNYQFGFIRTASAVQ